MSDKISGLVTVVCNAKRNISNCLDNIEKFIRDKIEYQVVNDFPFSSSAQALIGQSDLVIVLGGDGTTLEVTRCINDFKRTKVIPVDFGTLGYMTSVLESEVIEVIDGYLEYLRCLTQNKGGEKTELSELSELGMNDPEVNQKRGFKFDVRSLLSVEHQSQQILCLNEVFLTHSDPSKSINIEIVINEEILTKFKGDGVILSSPTGSTAYNMSIGGPILTPNVEGMVLTAVSPHILNLKPLVLSSGEKVKFYTPDVGILVVDGLMVCNIEEPVECCLAKEKLYFVKSLKENHIKVLKNKLHFGRN